MYRTIIVAYDGSPPAEAALRQAHQLASLCTAELHVMAVQVTAGRMMLDSAVIMADQLTLERGTLQMALNDAVRHIASYGVKATSVLRDGDAATEIIAYAREIGADLVVVGHGHKGLLARWFEGTLEQHLLDAMPCDVLIALPHALPTSP